MIVPRTCTKWSVSTEQRRRAYQEAREWEMFVKFAEKYVSQLNQKALEKLAALTHVELMERDIQAGLFDIGDEDYVR